MTSPTPSRPRLVRELRAVLLRHVLAFDDLFQAACERLESAYFHADQDIDLLLVWEAARAVLQRHCQNRIPEDRPLFWTMLDGELRGRLEAEPELSSLYGPLLFDQLLPWLFDSTAPLNRDYGRTLLTDYLRERTIYDPLRNLIDSLGNSVPESVNDVLQDFVSRDQQLGAIGAASGIRPTLEGYSTPQLDKSSTGIDFLDQMMSGGDAAGEVYVVLGAYGSGKTSLGIQKTFRKALQFQQEADQGKPLRDCHLFAYEATHDELRRRMWSHAAQVSTHSMENFDLATLSRTGHLKPYELELFAPEINEHGLAGVSGEFERLQEVQPLLSRNIFLHDFTGYPLPGKNVPSGLGVGYIGEITRVLTSYAQNGRHVGEVVIDYAGLCCRRYMMANNKRMEEIRYLLVQFADQVRRQIAIPFQCRVWFFHQLSGSANARTFGARIDATDSAECKSIGENVDFAFVIGPRHLETECMQLFCYKGRRSRLPPAPVLLRLRGEFNTLERAADMTVSATTGLPVPIVAASAQLQHMPIHALELLTHPPAQEETTTYEGTMDFTD